MVKDSEYSPVVDIYSLSLIVYELLVGEVAFPVMLGLGVLMEKIGSGARPPLPGDMGTVGHHLSVLIGHSEHSGLVQSYFWPSW
jgi:serine/threonine protein kinase